MLAFEVAMRGGQEVCLEPVWLNEKWAGKLLSPSPISLHLGRHLEVSRESREPGTNEGVVSSIRMYFRSALHSIPIPDKKRRKRWRILNWSHCEKWLVHFCISITPPTIPQCFSSLLEMCRIPFNPNRFALHNLLYQPSPLYLGILCWYLRVGQEN